MDTADNNCSWSVMCVCVGGGGGGGGQCVCVWGGGGGQCGEGGMWETVWGVRCVGGSVGDSVGWGVV